MVRPRIRARIRRIRNRLITSITGALLLALPGPVSSFDFRLGNAEGLFDATVSYGLQIRTQDQDEDIIGIGNGGKRASVNNDDGNLNHDKGITSNMLRGRAQLAMRWGSFGLFARGSGVYDYEQEDQNRERTDLTGDALDAVGSDADLREHYLSARLAIKGMPVNLRVGDQIVNWGEATFIRNGIDIVNPLDLVALFQPASLPRDVIIPQGMLWGAVNVTEVFSVEGYYQYEWKKVIVPPFGTYFSTNDLIGVDELNVAVLGGGEFSDLGTDLDAAFGLPAGTLGFDADFLKEPGRYVDEPSDSGQFGVALIGILPGTNATKIGLHFIRYHSRLPVLGGLTADQEAIAATSADNVAAQAAQLQPVYEATGLTPEEAAAEALKTAEFLTLSSYVNEAGYFATYPEDVTMVGLTFNTATLRTGTLFSGEVAHHRDFPFQIAIDAVLGATLSPVQYDPDLGDTPLGDFGADEVVSGIAELDRTQSALGVTQLLGPRLGAAQVLLAADLASVYVHDMPKQSELPLQGFKRPTEDSWGYRLAAQMQYTSIFGGLNLAPRVVFAHDFHGTTAAPLNTFVEGRKLVNVGLAADYINRWQADLSYTAFFGAGDNNLLNDRDFLRLRLTYSF